MTDLPAELLARLQLQAGNRCGYCRTSALITGQPLTVEHLMPIARGGTSTEENVWLSCRRCNEYKAVQIDAIDSDTGERVPLFNPRNASLVPSWRWTTFQLDVYGAISPLPP